MRILVNDSRPSRAIWIASILVDVELASFCDDVKIQKTQVIPVTTTSNTIIDSIIDVAFKEYFIEDNSSNNLLKLV